MCEVCVRFVPAHVPSVSVAAIGEVVFAVALARIRIRVVGKLLWLRARRASTGCCSCRCLLFKVLVVRTCEIRIRIIRRSLVLVFFVHSVRICVDLFNLSRIASHDGSQGSEAVAFCMSTASASRDRLDFEIDIEGAYGARAGQVGLWHLNRRVSGLLDTRVPFGVQARRRASVCGLLLRYKLGITQAPRSGRFSIKLIQLSFLHDQSCYSFPCLPPVLNASRQRVNWRAAHWTFCFPRPFSPPSPAWLLIT